MDMKREYYEDIQLFKTKTVLAATVLFLGVLAVVPFVVDGYTLYIINLIAIHSIVAIGLNILVGYTGQISPGHAGFFAIGAYSCVILMVKAGVPFIIALPAAGFISAMFGFLLGLPALRLEGPYLAIATLGFGMAVTQIISHWDFTGGHMGLEAPRMAIGSFVADTGLEQYAVIMAGTVILAIAAISLMKTLVGRAFVAIRDSEIAAEAMGINVSWFKTLSFAVSTFTPEVVELIRKEVDSVNATLAHVETVKKLTIVPKKLYEEDGEVTPTRKVKRKYINERFADLIEAMYKN